MVETAGRWPRHPILMQNTVSGLGRMITATEKKRRHLKGTTLPLKLFDEILSV